MQSYALQVQDGIEERKWTSRMVTNYPVKVEHGLKC